MRQSGLAKRADERDHLMLQILLLTEREVSAVVNMNQQIAERVGLSAISRDVEIQEMAKPTSIDNVAQTIQENLASE
jgi:FixJ family two-component response regulator